MWQLSQHLTTTQKGQNNDVGEAKNVDEAGYVVHDVNVDGDDGSYSYVYVLQQWLKKKFMVVFVQVVKKCALDLQNLLFTLTSRTSSLLPGFIDVCKQLGIRARF